MSDAQLQKQSVATRTPGVNLRVLKWFAIGLPLAFLIALDVLRHTVFESALGGFPGFFVFNSILAIAIIIFTFSVFGLMGRYQRRITEQNNELSALSERLQTQNRELSALLAVDKAITSSFDLDEVLSRALDTIIEVTTADAGEIWLVDTNDELLLRAHRGIMKELFLERTRLRLGEGLPGIAAQTQQSVVVHDLPSDPRFVRKGITNAGINTFCALPMRYQGRLVGTLTVAALSGESVSQQWELRLLEGISERVTVAIQNASLHQQVQDVAVLQERERIAREMHDGVGQVLGYINTQTLAVKKLLANDRVDAASEELTSMEEMARNLYADVREGMLGLRTAPHRDGGLIPAIREYVERYGEMSGLDTSVRVSPEVENSRLPPSTEIQLMRIIQEALSNVRKHADAKCARIEFRWKNKNLEIAISDDGKGFDPARIRSAGWPRFGLQTMRERAESVGGTFVIETSTGMGTEIVVSVPLDAQPEAMRVEP